jgi:hypothetical protein
MLGSRLIDGLKNSLCDLLLHGRRTSATAASLRRWSLVARRCRAGTQEKEQDGEADTANPGWFDSVHNNS